jgi:hypothetical protein
VSLFDWLLISHLIGDFLLQTQDMALLKAQSWSWMFRHIAVYMVLVTVVVVHYSVTHALPAWLAVGALLFLAGTHIVLDRRAFTNWWMRTIVKAPDIDWLSVVVDQVWHIVTLAIVAQVLVLASG